MPRAIVARDAPPRKRQNIYPKPLAASTQGRLKQPLGDVFGLSNFGVNLTSLAPGSATALRHAHSRQDEFVYVLEGRPTLITDAGEMLLEPGMCAGFPAGDVDGHHLVNRSAADVVLLEIGDRTAGDEPTYPDDDLRLIVDEEGGWRFAHKDGTPY